MNVDATVERPFAPKTRTLQRRAFIIQGLAGAVTACARAESMPGSTQIIHAPNVNKLSWSLDGRFIAASDVPLTWIALWNVQTGERLWRHEISPPARSVGISFVDGSRSVATVCQHGSDLEGNRVCLVDFANGSLATATPPLVAARQTRPPTALASSADQTVLALTDWSSSAINLLGFGGRFVVSRIGPFIQHQGTRPSFLANIALSPAGTKVAAGFYDGEVQVFDTRTGNSVCRIRAYRNVAVSALAFVDEFVLATASLGMHVFGPRAADPWPDYVTAPEYLDSFSPGQPLHSPIRIWNTLTSAFTATLDTSDTSGIREGYLAACGDFVVAIFESGFIQKWQSISHATLSREQPSGFDPVLSIGGVAVCHQTKQVAVAASNKIYIL